jgi:hypothetical protein
MRLRSTAVAALLFAGISIPMAGTAFAADIYNCGDFSSQQEAQAEYAKDTSDPNQLDRDKDGQACEDYAYAAGATSTTGGQVSARPAGAVAAGDGSSSEGGSSLPYVLGGLAFAGAGGAALAARRSSRTTV